MSKILYCCEINCYTCKAVEESAFLVLPVAYNPNESKRKLSQITIKFLIEANQFGFAP